MSNQKVAPGYDPQQQQGYGMQGQQAYGMQQQMGAPPVYSNQPQHAPPGMVVQPQEWVAPVEAIPGCPPGLEYLTALDQIVVKQEIELLKAFTGFPQNHKYKILNNQGQQIYFAAEDTGICMNFCCGPQRSFVIHILNNSNQEVIRLTREFKCCAGSCWLAGSDACAHEVQVEAPVGQIIGYIRQEYSNWQQNFSIRDASHNPILRIHGPCCVFNMSCCQDVFKIWSEDDTQELGTICKQAGLRELLLDANTFGATFPMNLDPKAKAILFGAVFLIDFMYFVKYKNREVSCSV